MNQFGWTRRLVAMMMALLVMLSVGSALAQQADADVEEQGILSGFWDFAKTAVKGIGDALLKDENPAQAKSGKWGIVRSTMRTVGKFGTSAVDKVKNFAVDSYNKVKDVAVTSYTVIKDGVESVFDKTKDAPLTGAYEKPIPREDPSINVSIYEDAVNITKRVWNWKVSGRGV